MSTLTITYIVIVFFIITIFVLWLSILNHITYSKLKENQYLRLEKNLIEGIVSSYSEDSNKLAIQKLQHTSHYIKNNYIKFSDVASVFLKVNRVFKFSKCHNFKTLFCHLELNSTLRSKLKTDDWYEKSKAILLSYELGLNENNLIISAYKDHENKLVRREVQIALVAFLGWKSLASLPDVTKPISLWQQIRIIEKLQEIDTPFDFYSFEKALKTGNFNTKELLVRIIKNFKLYNYTYYIKAQLNSDNKQLAKVAAEALVQLDLEINGQEVKQINLKLLRVSNLRQAEMISSQRFASNLRYLHE